MSITWNREDLAWAAGFFDGEGSTGCNWQKNHPNGNRYRYLRMQVDQVEPTTLQRLQSILGGKLTGPYSPRNINHSPHWHWVITSFEEVQFTVCRLWPWLSKPKRNQIKIAVKNFHTARG